MNVFSIALASSAFAGTAKFADDDFTVSELTRSAFDAGNTAIVVSSKDGKVTETHQLIRDRTKDFNLITYFGTTAGAAQVSKVDAAISGLEILEVRQFAIDAAAKTEVVTEGQTYTYVPFSARVLHGSKATMTLGRGFVDVYGTLVISKANKCSVSDTSCAIIGWGTYAVNIGGSGYDYLKGAIAVAVPVIAEQEMSKIMAQLAVVNAVKAAK